MTVADLSGRHGRGAVAPPSLRAALVVMWLVVGLGLGRFFLYPPAAPTTPVTAAGLPEQIAGLEEAVAANPADLSGLQTLADLYLRRATETGDPGFYRLAESALDRAGRVLPDDVFTLLGRGRLALARHEFADAAGIADAARAIDPSSPELMAVAVDAAVELGDYERAATTLQQLLDARPALPALARTSYLRQLHGDLDGAITAMEQALTAGAGESHDLAVVTALRGDLAWIGGDAATAARSYRRALELAPELVPATVGLARVMAAEGAPAPAVDLLAAAIDRFPDPGAVALRGELLTGLGREDEAAEMFSLVDVIRRLQIEAGSVVDLEVAVFAADHGDPAAAVAAARAAYQARPGNVYAADALGWALMSSGDPLAAVRYAREAVRLDSADPGIHFHAAAVLAAAGETTAARHHLERVLDLNPRYTPTIAAGVGPLAAELGVPA